MYEENARNSSSGIIFPFFLKSHSGEGQIYFSRDDNANSTFFDNKIQSKEFQIQYNKLFNTKNLFRTMSRNGNSIGNVNSNNINDNKLKKVEEVLNSLEDISSITNDLEGYIKLSECLFDMLQLTTSLPKDNTDYPKSLVYQSKLIDKIIDYIKPKLSET